MSLTKVKTPCIGVCSTGIGDDVCRGCKRFAHEVIHWNAYTTEQHQAIRQRLSQLLAQVVSAKIAIVDQPLLEQSITRLQLRFDPAASPYCWVFDLLKAGASQINDFAEYGCRVLPQWQDYSAVALKEQIDGDFYTLSCVHYERYFAAPKGGRP